MRPTLQFLMALILLLPACAYAYSLDIDITAESRADLPPALMAAFSSGRGGDEAPGGAASSVRLIPPGYEVVGHEIIWQQWEEAGSWPGEPTERAGDGCHVAAGDFLGYNLLTVSMERLRTEGPRALTLRGARVRVECRAAAEDLRPARRSPLTDAHLREMIGALTGEPVQAYGDWIIDRQAGGVSEAPSLEGSAVDCVIICPADMAAAYEDLARWHDGLGIRTAVRDLDWIEANYMGGDAPERIRNFIRDAYVNWGTVYAVLGGDATVVPIRHGWTDHYGGASIPSDVYYSSLEGTWNDDGDDVFGEFEDGVTFERHVITGRIPARSASDAADYTRKAMAYATSPAPGFARTALLVGEVLFPDDWVPGQEITLDGADICDAAAAYFPGDMDTSKIYQSVGTMNRDTCLRGFSSGDCLVIIAGHGDAFRTSAAEGDPPFIYCGDMDTLSNDGRFSFVFALNCNNAAIDVDCVFRHYVLNPGGGAIGAYATTRFDFPNSGQYSLNHFCDALYQQDITRAGDICVASELDMVPSAVARDGSVRWNLLTYILLGDPTLDLWADEPETLEVAHAGTMALSDSTYTVAVSSEGAAVGGARVVLMGALGEYASALTGADGIAQLDYRPRGPGSADLVVSGSGYLVYEDSVTVTASGARCFVKSATVYDAGGWQGNGDGDAGWCERVGLGVGIANLGDTPAGDVLGTLAAVEGCSLWVDITFDGSHQPDRIHIGPQGLSPGTVPFGLATGEAVLGDAYHHYAGELGCWLWLDAAGWHARFLGTGDSLVTYECSFDCTGDILGLRQVDTEVPDSLSAGPGHIVFGGHLGEGDPADGFDFQSGANAGVVLHDSVESYGSVGSAEVVRTYDVEFTGLTGDRIGVWFELAMEDTSGEAWRDWFQVLVHDGRLEAERIHVLADTDSTRTVVLGLRNLGTGGLMDINGTMRALSGAAVDDSTSAYGDLLSLEYAEGDTYALTLTGGEVCLEFELTDAYARAWVETVCVRSLDAPGGLRYECGADYIELAWDADADSLGECYDVYRADESGGAYSMVGIAEGFTWLCDSGLDSEEDYFYYVCARDIMGNVSAPSGTLEAWTGAPNQSGWPVYTTGAVYSSPCPRDLDGDGCLEVVAGCRNEFVYAWDCEGNTLPGWPKRTGGIVRSSPAVADLDDDGFMEIVIGSDNGWIYAYNHDGTGLVSGGGTFRPVSGRAHGSPTLVDLDDDGDLEVLATSTSGRLYVWHHDGTGYTSPNGVLANIGYEAYGSPSVGDLDGDGDLEIVVAITGGKIYVFNADGTGYLDPSGLFASPGAIFGSCTLGDIDANGDLEIIAGGLYWQGIWVFDHDGTYHSGFPRALVGLTRSMAGLAELDGDGYLDIVIGTGETLQGDSACVYVISHDGAVREGWPHATRGNFESSPVIGDIDGDSEPEIVVGCTDGKIYAWNPDGSRVPGFPRSSPNEVLSTAAITDLDSDGDVEIVIGGHDGKVYAFDLSSPYDPVTMEWPKYAHDCVNSGLYSDPATAGVPICDPRKPGNPNDPNGPGDPSDPGGSGDLPRVFSVKACPSPATSEVKVSLRIPAALAGTYSVDVYDVRGRRIRSLGRSHLEPGTRGIDWGCDDATGQRLAPGIYFLQVAGPPGTFRTKLVLLR